MNGPTSVVIVAMYVLDVLMVSGGGVVHVGLLRVALKFDGQSADVVTAESLVSPEPPAIVDAVVLVAVVDFFPGLKMR